jgi:arylformamidase
LRIIDLSMPIYTGMDVYAGDPEVSIEVVQTYEKNTWQLRKLTLGTHTGTHVDAFSHMHASGKTLDKIPLARFFGKAVVTEPTGTFPVNMGLFFKEDVDVDIFDRIMTSKPPFVGGLISEPLERALLNEEIVTFTNLVNLDFIPENIPFMFYGFPLKIMNGDGSPVRAIAILE